MNSQNGGVDIKECYPGKPLFHPMAAVQRLLAGVPGQYLRGLRTVVVRDAGSLNHERRRAKVWRLGRKVRAAQCTGLYHEAYKGEPAWIEIFVDNVLAEYVDSLIFRFLVCIPIVADFVIGRALYHELGHHIHKTRVPEHRGKETAADVWEQRLMRGYLTSRYWYITKPVLILLWPLWKLRKRYSRGTKYKA